jgi:hypothetical protein
MHHYTGCTGLSAQDLYHNLIRLDMEDFKTMETAALLHMLAKQTTVYESMLADGAVDANFLGCQSTIIMLQSEIISRIAVSWSAPQDALLPIS